MKTKILFAATLLLLCVTTLLASDTQVNGIWYNFDRSSQTATVTYRGSSYYSYDNEYTGSVVIPSSITYNGTTYSVTSIGDQAFSGCMSLTSVTIPNSVTSIGDQAFSGCMSLTSVTIPNSVTSIGQGAFWGCLGLTSVTIPNSVTSIGYEVFRGCSGLTSVTIGNGVTSIGNDAFYNCSGLTEVHISDIATWCNISFGTNHANPLYYAHHLYLNDTEITDLVIPNSVTSIGAGAFRDCTNLTSVTIGNGVTSIGYEVFRGCSGLTSVTIPNSVTSIGGGAFHNCSGLTEVHISDIADWCNISFADYTANPLYYAHHLYLNDTKIKDLVIPGSVTSIGNYAFYYCSSLKSVTIGNSVTSIGAVAFSRCSGLTSVTIPNSVTSIGGGAFMYCIGLTSVTIPNSVTSIGQSAFLDCSGLTSVTIGNGVTSIGNDAFYNCSGLTEVHISDIATWCNISFGTNHANPLYYAHHLYLNDTEITDLVIPNSVTSIGKYTFYGYSGLTVTIGNNVTTIGDYAFQNCSNLETISLGNSLQTIGASAFSGCQRIIDIYCYAERVPDAVSSTFDGVSRKAYLWVPANRLRNYQTHEIWGEFVVQAMSADGVNATTVNVVPDYNTAKVVWPEVAGADTYEIVIRDQQGNVICSLVFNSDGQLQSIAFSAPVRDRDNAPEQAQSTGFRFEVTGLDEGTTYNYTITAKDAGETVLDTQSGSFTTKGGTGVEEVEGQKSLVESPQKVIENGQVIIIMPDGTTFDATGRKL